MAWDDIKIDDGGVTEAGRLPAAEYNNLVLAVKARLLESLYDANTIIKADADDTPAALTVGEQTLVGRITGGLITALTPAQIRTLLNVEDGSEANNISDVNATDLTDGLDSTLHYHAADRSRTVHTGTQTASTISDFDVEVGNNSAVVANTAKVTNATHTGDVTGDGALVIGADKVLDSHVNWGTAATQVSAVDMPIADAGSKITATEVEGALQENRTAVDLNTTHKNSDGSDHTFIDQNVVSGASPTFIGTNVTAVPVANVDVATYGTPVIDDLKSLLNRAWSTGVYTGGVITDVSASSKITISAGSGLIRETSDETAELLYIEWAETDILYTALTSDVTNYICLRMITGTATFVIETNESNVDHIKDIHIGFLWMNGGVLSVSASDTILNLNDVNTRRLLEQYGYHNVSGAMIGVPTATLNLTLTASVWYVGNVRFTLNAIDTGGADIFSYFYRDGVGGFTEVVTQSVIDNTYYDDGSGTLVALGVNNYGVHWIYVDSDNNLLAQYGRGDYNTFAAAEAEEVPSTAPDYFEDFVKLVGKVIVLKGASTSTDVYSPFTEVFATASPTNHNDLAGLNAGDLYEHLTATQVTKLDGVADGAIANVVEDTTPQLGGDLDAQGNSLVACQSIANLAGKGPSLYLDGVDDFINLDALAGELVNVNNTEGAIVWKGKIHDFVTLNSKLWSLSDTNAVEDIQVYVGTGILLAICRVASVIKWQLSTDATFEENVEYEIVLAHDGTTPILYVNGKLESITFSTEVDKSVWLADTTGIDNGRIGCFRLNSSSNASFLNCTVNKFYALNVCPTAAEVLAMYEGGNIPFSWIGADMTDYVVDGDMSVPASWNVKAGVIISGGVAAFDGTTNTSIYQTLSNFANKLGKVVLLKYTISGQTIGSLKVPNFTWVNTFLDPFVNLISTNGIHSVYLDVTDVGQGIEFLTSDGFNGNVDDISIIQVGAIGQYEQDGICYSQLLDKSGNKFHGVIDGAVPINLSPDHKEQYPHLTSITTNTAWTDVVPAGYLLEYIVFEGENTNDATIDLGTTTSASDVFSQEIIAGSDLTITVINKMFSKTAAQSLYLNDSGAGTWNGASVLATLYMSKVEV